MRSIILIQGIVLLITIICEGFCRFPLKLPSKISANIKSQPFFGSSSLNQFKRSDATSNHQNSDFNLYASGKTLHQSNTQRSSHKSRRKMGPPLRKQFNDDPSQQHVGRVTVYCVGGGLDLRSLRAYVFRRGFQGISPISNSLNYSKLLIDPTHLVDAPKNLVLSHRVSSEKDVEDEVLHVTNSPQLMNLDPSYRSYNNTNLHLENNEDDEESDAEIRRNMMLFRSTQDIFYFEYGCVVFWGLSPQEEKAGLAELEPFIIDNTSSDELRNSHDDMEYTYDRKANPQRPVRFDRIRVRTLDPEEKLALSYGMAQSSKLFVLESRVLKSIEMTRQLPKDLSTDGKIKMNKKDINRLIGKLFVEQTEVNLFSSILDSPAFLWDNDEHLPAYEYIRSYLEVEDRVELLNSRLSVIRELLDVLNAQVAHNNSERLEWIAIWLIIVEIGLSVFSNPIFTDIWNKMIFAVLVPSAIMLFKKTN